MKFFRKFAANNKKWNASFRFRSARMKLLRKLIMESGIDKPLLLDIGGSYYYWKNFESALQSGVKLILLNINKSAIGDYAGIVGDARNLNFVKSGSADFVLSNSLIEHLGEFENQKKYAEEIQRISRNFFVQTPAFIFPLEPHFLFPFFHWLPKKVRLYLITHFALGWFEKFESADEAKKLIDETRIMKKKELMEIFPHAEIITEFFFFIPKSYIVIGKGK